MKSPNETMLTLVVPVIILLVFGAYLAFSQSVFFDQNSSVNAEVESPKGLVIDLSLDSNTFFPGDGILISITESNPEYQILNLTAANRWAMKGLAVSDCGTGSSPIGVGVAEGYYTLANVSQLTAANLLDIFPFTFGCLSIAPPSHYLFQPRRDVADLIWNSSYPFGPGNLTISYSISTGPFCCVNGSVEKNQINLPQTFTVFGGDEWGDLAILHFMVVP
jgi:hypothetical protein